MPQMHNSILIILIFRQKYNIIWLRRTETDIFLASVNRTFLTAAHYIVRVYTSTLLYLRTACIEVCFALFSYVPYYHSFFIQSSNNDLTRYCILRISTEADKLLRNKFRCQAHRCEYFFELFQEIIVDFNTYLSHFHHSSICPRSAAILIMPAIFRAFFLDILTFAPVPGAMVSELHIKAFTAQEIISDLCIYSSDSLDDVRSQRNVECRTSCISYRPQTAFLDSIRTASDAFVSLLRFRSHHTNEHLCGRHTADSLCCIGTESLLNRAFQE